MKMHSSAHAKSCTVCEFVRERGGGGVTIMGAGNLIWFFSSFWLLFSLAVSVSPKGEPKFKWRSPIFFLLRLFCRSFLLVWIKCSHVNKERDREVQHFPDFPEEMVDFPDYSWLLASGKKAFLNFLTFQKFLDPYEPCQGDGDWAQPPTLSIMWYIPRISHRSAV